MHGADRSEVVPLLTRHSAPAPGWIGCVKMFEKYKNRLMFMDYKDARWTTPKADLVLPNGRSKRRILRAAKFFESIYDLGDGDIDFPALHRVLKQVSFKGWNCVDLDRTRNGPRASYEHCGQYIVNKLEPIYSMTSKVSDRRHFSEVGRGAAGDSESSPPTPMATSSGSREFGVRTAISIRRSACVRLSMLAEPGPI